MDKLGFKTTVPFPLIWDFIIIILRGFGQIILQNNALTGLFFLTGIFCGSLFMGFASLLAVVVGTLAARWLGYDRDKLKQGLYGFSAGLVGVLVGLYVKPSLFSIFLIVGGGVAATLIQEFFMLRKIPVFTFPFVLMGWVILLLTQKFLPGKLVYLQAAEFRSYAYLFLPLRAYGQVIFQSKAIAGLFIFVGVLINAPVKALYGLIAAILSSLVALFLLRGYSYEIILGLYGFNAVLCAVLFGGTALKDAFWVLVSVTISLFIVFVMKWSSIPMLTFPFVLASVITLILQKLTVNRITK